MKLLSTAWILPIDYENNVFNFFLMFYEDDVFKFGGQSAGVLVTGKYKIKNNKVTAIRFQTLAAICEALQCEAGDILEYSSEE